MRFDARFHIFLVPSSPPTPVVSPGSRAPHASATLGVSAIQPDDADPCGGQAVTSKFGRIPLYWEAGALVAAWRPGVEGGHALWELMTGAQSFSGRLAQAWPHNAGAAHLGKCFITRVASQTTAGGLPLEALR
jgi:hypothetical protein